MNHRRFDPVLYSQKGSELSLSGDALLGLMRAVLAKGVPFRFRARGWSMEPFISDGDVIEVSPLKPGMPRPGQVVAFVHPAAEKLVVHRVIGRCGVDPIIRGDNVPDIADGVIQRENILGYVTQVTRNGRRVWLGLGPERYLVAFLSRTGLRLPLELRLRPLFRPLLRRYRG